MTTAQYQRLLLVLALPLLLAGFLLAEEQLLLPQRTTTLCDVMPDSSYRCDTILSKSSGYLANSYELGGVWLSRAWLPDGFAADVITTPMLDVYFEGGVRRERPIGGGVRKQLRVGARQGASTGESCTLEMATDQSWHLWCRKSQVFESFRIVDPAVHARYADAVAQIRAGVAKSEERARRAFWISVVTPLAAFLALSLVGWLLLRAARFVIGTPPESTDSA